MTDNSFEIIDGILTKYSGKGSDAVIPEGVKVISSAAFSFCKALEEIVIPEGVTVIGEDAFIGCVSLKRVVIPESVTEIGKGAFDGCTSLTDIVLPKSVTVIGDGAFRGCKGLADDKGFVIVNNVVYGYFGSETDLVLPKGITGISDWAFYQCENLEKVVIPESVTFIGYNAFDYYDDITIFGVPGSEAEAFAKENEIKFSAL